MPHAPSVGALMSEPTYDAQGRFTGMRARACGEHVPYQPDLSRCRDCGDRWCTPESLCLGCTVGGLVVRLEALEARLERLGSLSAHEHEWEVEYLPDPMSAGSVVRSGELRCWCGETMRDA